jgi:hypothetical protein
VKGIRINLTVQMSGFVGGITRVIWWWVKHLVVVQRELHGECSCVSMHEQQSKIFIFIFIFSEAIRRIRGEEIISRLFIQTWAQKIRKFGYSQL